MTNPVVWFEVLGNNGKALQEFYGSLFGWTYKVDPMQYGMVEAGPRGIPGGVGQAGPNTRNWTTFYVETADVNAALATAERLGGKVVTPRTVLPDVTLGVFQDPEGHIVGLVEAKAA